jgi:sarcosine oxidase subunit alpha
MTCQTLARDGDRVETQNSLGTRTVDLLRVTDWFFSDGLDHHHFLAGVPGVSAVMQTIARRVAGLGTLPLRPKATSAGERLAPDVLVVGAGVAGIAAASVLGQAGHEVLLVDDAGEIGGSARALGARALADLLAALPLGGVSVRTRTTAAGIYQGEALIAGPEGAARVRPRAIVLATGAHDGVAFFENNELPGVLSARAAALLAAGGVAIGRRVVVAGEGPFADALGRLLGSSAEILRVELGAVRKAEGSSRVGGVELAGGQRLRADAIVIETPPSPAFELAEQGGARARWFEGRGFVPEADAEGLAAPGLWVAGELRGAAFDPGALLAEGRRVGAAVSRALVSG